MYSNPEKLGAKFIGTDNYSVKCLLFSVDPCYVSNYNVLSGQVKRSSNYTLLKNEKPIDDSILLTAWYKIESDTGNDIVMTEQRMEQCGTKYPIWMKGLLKFTIKFKLDVSFSLVLCLSR